MNKITPSSWAVLATAQELPLWLEPYVQESVYKILRARSSIYFLHLQRNFKAERFWMLVYTILWTHDCTSQLSYADWQDAIKYINRLIEITVTQCVNVDEARSKKLVELVQLLFSLQVYVEVYSFYTEVRVVRTSCLVFDPWPRIKVVANERTDAYSYVELSSDMVSIVRSFEECEKLKQFTIDWSWRICGFTTHYFYENPKGACILRGIQYIFLNDPSIGVTYVFVHECGTSGSDDTETIVRNFLVKDWRIGYTVRNVTSRFLVLNGHTYWGFHVLPGPVVYTAITGVDTIDVLAGYMTVPAVVGRVNNACNMVSEPGKAHKICRDEFRRGNKLMRVFYPWNTSHGDVCSMGLFQRAELDRENGLFWYAPIMDYYAFVGVHYVDDNPYYYPRPILTYLKYRADVDDREYDTYLTFAFEPANASDRVYCAHGCFHEHTVGGLLALAEKQDT